MKQIALLFPPVRDCDVDIARVCKDGELVLRLERRSAKMRPVRAMSSDGRGAGGMGRDRGRAADGERALCALRVRVGNHAQLLN